MSIFDAEDRLLEKLGLRVSRLYVFYYRVNISVGFTLVYQGMRVSILYNSLNYGGRTEGDAPLDEKGVLYEVEAVDEALSDLDVAHTTVAVGESLQEWLEDLLAYRPDVVFNLCEAVAGRSSFEMNIPSVLELLHIPYTGSSPLTLGLCQNKVLAKSILRSRGIPTPKYCVINEKFDVVGRAPSFPVIVKPIQEDGGVGIGVRSVASNRSEMEALAREVWEKHQQPALVEEYIDGRELNVAVLGGDTPQPLPISEIVFPQHYKFKVVSYEVKWMEDSDIYKDTTSVCPIQIESDIEAKVMETAVKAYKTVGCRDYARVDIRLRGDKPYVLEVNPNPDISPGLGLPRSLEVAGISYRDFVMRIVSSALQRGG